MSKNTNQFESSNDQPVSRRKLTSGEINAFLAMIKEMPVEQLKLLSGIFKAIYKSTP